MKICSKCGVDKPVGEFYIHRKTRDGLRAECKVCVCAMNKAWVQANPEKRRVAARAQYKTYPERARARTREWRKAHPEYALVMANARRKANPARALATAGAWKKANPEKCAALNCKRRADKLQATPAWANQGYIEDVYRKAAIFTKRDEKPWHVDHIIPLKSKLVCGLHCEDNLQAISGVENITKGNRQWPDMPGAV